MKLTWACLSCALKNIPDIHPLLIQAKGHLKIAIDCSNSYYHTWYSIIWIDSSASTKRRVSEQLNHLAYDCYTHFIIASEYLNQYADVMNSEKATVPKWWSEVVVSLTLAHDSIQQENKSEIYCKQLRLI